MLIPQRPPLSKLAYEAKSCALWLSAFQLSRELKHWKRANGTPVLLLPGLATNQWAMLPMRQCLSTLGYQPYDWNMGFNTGPTKQNLDQLTRSIKALSKQHGEPVALVGWSLGGAIARAIAARIPKHVRCVVAFGSPLNRYLATHLDNLFALLSENAITDPKLFKWLEAPVPTVPITSIASVDDGLLSWQSSTLPKGPMQETIFLRGIGHLALPVHPHIIRLVHDRILQDPGTWKAYAGRSVKDKRWNAPRSATTRWQSAIMKQ